MVPIEMGFESLGLVMVALLFGSMVFFSGVMAPLMFIELGVDTAGRLVRRVFPWYFLLIGVAALIAALSLFGRATEVAWIMTGVLIGAVVSRQVLMPGINRSRDLASSGDRAAARRFDLLHRTSVMINGAQILATLVALILLA